MADNYFNRALRNDTDETRGWYESSRGAIVIATVAVAVFIAFVYNLIWG